MTISSQLNNQSIFIQQNIVFVSVMCAEAQRAVLSFVNGLHAHVAFQFLFTFKLQFLGQKLQAVLSACTSSMKIRDQNVNFWIWSEIFVYSCLITPISFPNN